MSALWVLALGGSVGYLMTKRQAVESKLDEMVKDWEGSGAQAATASVDGATFKEIKTAWKSTEHTRTRDFDERLPNAERNKILQRQDLMAKQVHDFDQAAGETAIIQGVYLESAIA
jgi:hypothetical protein